MIQIQELFSDTMADGTPVNNQKSCKEAANRAAFFTTVGHVLLSLPPSCILAASTRSLNPLMEE
jgi:hypothetical protein